MKTVSFGSAPWPYNTPEDYREDAPEIYSDLSDKVGSNPNQVEGESVGVFILAGQSLAANTCSGDYFTPINAAKCDQISIYNGGTYRAVDPLIGTSVGVNGQANLFTRVADSLVTSGKYDRVIVIPAAVGGTTIEDWATLLYPRIRTAYRWARALRLEVTAVLWQQGEAEADEGTTQAQYVEFFHDMRVALGDEDTAPWVLAKSTFDGSGINNYVRAADDELALEDDVFLGPDCDTIGVEDRRAPNFIHFSEDGSIAAAALWTSAISANL